jgi:hypothetical protein
MHRTEKEIHPRPEASSAFSPEVPAMLARHGNTNIVGRARRLPRIPGKWNFAKYRWCGLQCRWRPARVRTSVPTRQPISADNRTRSGMTSVRRLKPHQAFPCHIVSPARLDLQHCLFLAERITIHAFGPRPGRNSPLFLATAGS